MPLAMLSFGEKRVIVNLRVKDDMKRHLQDMGFLAGEMVEVVGENASGIILLIKGTRVAINKGLASQIYVA
jgi:Fe2+ transport system protein A